MVVVMTDILKMPDGGTPGDLFRAVASFYDAHPDLAMPAVHIHDHPRDGQSPADRALYIAWLAGIAQTGTSDLNNGHLQITGLQLADGADGLHGPGSVKISAYDHGHGLGECGGSCPHPLHWTDRP